MRLFANKDNKRLFCTVAILLFMFDMILEGVIYLLDGRIVLSVLFLAIIFSITVLMVIYHYLQQQDRMMEKAVSQIEDVISGNINTRIDCDHEGEVYRLFHSVNTLAAICNAQVEKESREKEEMKNSILDISHQLKTPLAALNIYNGILQEEAKEQEELQQFISLSEQELDRIEMLVQNLLKLAKLDAGTLFMEKNRENVAEMIRDIELHFGYRAKQEEKEIYLEGAENVYLDCDRDWLMEAIENLVKNALDHTKSGDTIQIFWKQLTPQVVQIMIHDNGSGIHPEDIYHIFKRFYRSRFSKDKQGIGLGLPLTKAIVEAHHGTIEVDSELGKGSTFRLQFLVSNP